MAGTPARRRAARGRAAFFARAAFALRGVDGLTAGEAVPALVLTVGREIHLIDEISGPPLQRALPLRHSHPGDQHPLNLEPVVEHHDVRRRAHRQAAEVGPAPRSRAGTVLRRLQRLLERGAQPDAGCARRRVCSRCPASVPSSRRTAPAARPHRAAAERVRRRVRQRPPRRVGHQAEALARREPGARARLGGQVIAVDDQPGRSRRPHERGRRDPRVARRARAAWPLNACPPWRARRGRRRRSASRRRRPAPARDHHAASRPARRPAPGRPAARARASWRHGSRSSEPPASARSGARRLSGSWAPGHCGERNGPSRWAPRRAAARRRRTATRRRPLSGSP